MENVTDLLSLVTGPIVAFMVFLGWSVRKVNTRVDNMVTEKQVRQIIEDKVGVVRAQQEGFSDRLRVMEAKIDRLIDFHINANKN